MSALRQGGDASGQRRHIWGVVERLVSGQTPAFELWSGEGAVFTAVENPGAAGGMRGFDRPASAKADAHTAGAPVVTYTLYNKAAFDHIRQYRLHMTAALNELRVGANEASVPAFPADATVIKTAWWPVAGEGLTAMPVWDPKLNPPERRGNPYISWRRVVAVDASGDVLRPDAPVSFMGREFPKARRVALDAFHTVPVDSAMAARLSRDPESRRSAAIALGRAVRAGDYLALVAINLMTHEQEDWAWAALWWHDQPQVGPFASGRPPSLAGPWKNYLMQAAFDEQTPLADDGGPHVAFNPWLEARFPDGGQGGGTQSNCMACHRRASYPAEPFLPVTRGASNGGGDTAASRGSVRTSFLWSLPLHAQP